MKKTDLTEEEFAEAHRRSRTAVFVGAGLAFLAVLLFTQNFPAALAITIGNLLIPGIVAFIASRRSPNWWSAFVVAWVVITAIQLFGILGMRNY